jgi:tRNA-splicing ligase RtcB
MKTVEACGHTLTETKKNIWFIEPKPPMIVPVKLFTNEKLLEHIKDDNSIQQACNVATLPGIKNASIVQADMHLGYGLPIGGVAAFDIKEGVISPGGVGFDINCGVRVLATPLTEEEVRPKIKELLERLYANCPVGVGSEARIRLSDEDYEDLMKNGAKLGCREWLWHC